MQVLSARKNANHHNVLCTLPKNTDVVKTVNKHFNHGYLMANPDEHKCSSAWDCAGCPASNILKIKHCGGNICLVTVKEFTLFDRA